MQTEELDQPCRPTDRIGIQEAAEIRRRYLLWLAGKLRLVSPETTKFDDWQLALAAAEALEQLAS
jgi:hypothetical protein